MSKDSIFDDIKDGLSPISKTINIKVHLQKAGFWWNDDRLGQLYSELNELSDELKKEEIDKQRVSDEIGDVMFILTTIAQNNDVNIEKALEQTNKRVEKRFRHVEKSLKNINKNFQTTNRDEVLKYWKEAKKLEKKN